MTILALKNKFRLAVPALALAALLATISGCKKTEVPASQPATRSDQQVGNDIQAKIGAETALSGQNVQVDVQGGVATLSGAVSDNASRSLAGNDAGTVDGVKTVVNNLVVQPPVTAQTPAPVRVPDQDRRRSRREERDRQRNAARDQDIQQAQEQAPPPPPQDQPAPPPTQAQAPPPADVQAVPPPSQPLPVAPPPAPPAAVAVTIPADTVISVRISEALDSSQAQANDSFHGAIAGDLVVDGMVALPRGASVIGRVIDARDAAHFKGSSLLSIELTQVTARGRDVPLVTDAYTKEGAGRGKNTAAKGAGGAALGAIIGALAGGGKGAAIGAAAGGGIGAGSNGVTRGEQVQIAPETVVNFRLQSPITVTTGQKAGVRRPYEQDAPTLEPR